MFNQSTSLQVPFLNFTTLSFAAPLLEDVTERYHPEYFGALLYAWNGPSQVVERITALVTVQGVILPLTAPSPNSSWHLEFWGPSLKCGHVDDARRQRIESNIATFYGPGMPCLDTRPLYLSWFQDLPYILTHGWNDADIESGSNATITIAAFPGMLSYDPCDRTVSNLTTIRNQISAYSTNPLGNASEGSTMIQCQLFNSTYKADFVYLESSQSIAVNAPVKSSDKPFTTFQYVLQWFSSDHTLSECINLDTDTLPESCDLDPTIFPIISYQAVMEAFTSVLSGTVIDDTYEDKIIRNSSILSTALVDTKELAFLNNQTAGYFVNDADLGSSLAKLGKMDVCGFPQANRLTSNRSLSDALEEMFRNLTISLMSSDLLR